ncbi:MAG: T9SS type A sorting domain-containing protein, partial [bacterium]
MFSYTQLDTILPTSNDPGGGLTLSLYCWDVTPLCYGNGFYPFSCFHLNQSYLIFLVIVYENPALPWVRIQINSGAESLLDASSTTYFEGFGSNTGTLRILSQAGDPDGSNEMISFNGQILAGPWNVFYGNIGDHADYHQFDVVNVDIADTLELSTGSDQIGIHLAILIGDPAVDFALLPYELPIQIPPEGASFDFYVMATNHLSGSLMLDFWTDVIKPNGSILSPVLGPANVPLNPGTMGWIREQIVPDYAPSGMYTYVGNIGVYPDEIWLTDSFQFEKVSGSDNSTSGWSNWDEDRLMSNPEIQSVVPLQFNLHPCFPNPFNPLTTIRFDLPQAVKINLSIYDITGALVATLAKGWREAGAYEVGFDGSNLASGIYLYRLVAGDFCSCGKMVLVK